MPRRIRKPIHELSVADLQQHAQWEYAADEEGRPGQDECTVRPITPGDVRRATHQVFLRATFYHSQRPRRPGRQQFWLA